MTQRSDGGPIDSPIYFAVAETNPPTKERYAVIRIDTSKPQPGGGVEGVVESLHWSREWAQGVADSLNADLNKGSLQ